MVDSVVALVVTAAAELVVGVDLESVVGSTRVLSSLLAALDEAGSSKRVNEASGLIVGEVEVRTRVESDGDRIESGIADSGSGSVISLSSTTRSALSLGKHGAIESILIKFVSALSFREVSLEVACESGDVGELDALSAA